MASEASGRHARRRGVTCGHALSYKCATSRARHSASQDLSQSGAQRSNPRNPRARRLRLASAAMSELDPRRRLGAFGEALARRHLEARGLGVLDANYRTRYGDLVAADRSNLVFCEVKTRVLGDHPAELGPFAPVRTSAARCAGWRGSGWARASLGGSGRPRSASTRSRISLDRAGRLLDSITSRGLLMGHASWLSPRGRAGCGRSTGRTCGTAARPRGKHDRRAVLWRRVANGIRLEVPVRVPLGRGAIATRSWLTFASTEAAAIAALRRVAVDHRALLDRTPAP